MINLDEYDTLRGSSLYDLVFSVTRFGDMVESRYGDCLEILGGRLKCESGVLIEREGINYSLGWMEMFQLLAGVYDPDNLKRIAPNANHDLFTYEMAYGPRVIDKVPGIIQALSKDRNTRQAVLFVGNPGDGPTSSLPCTLTIQFVIRFDCLHAIVNMRSWDVCRGLPYDLMMFSGLLEMVGRCLIIPTGNIIVQAGSTHIYMDQMDKLPKLRRKKWGFTEEVPDAWGDSIEWFGKEMHNIQQGVLPPGIAHVS